LRSLVYAEFEGTSPIGALILARHVLIRTETSTGVPAKPNSSRRRRSIKRR